LLKQKYATAAVNSLGHYSFYIGASNDNLEEVMKTDIKKVCGLKIFMGSSTGNLLVDDPKVLEGFFSKWPSLIATHCEDEPTIRKNNDLFRAKYGEDVPMELHPQIRSEEACYKSSSFAVRAWPKKSVAKVTRSADQFSGERTACSNSFRCRKSRRTVS